MRKYLGTGEEVEVLVTLKDPPLHVVRMVLVDDDMEFLSDPMIVEKVYASPPTEKLHEKVKRLKEEIAELNEEIYDLREGIKKLELERRPILAKLTQIPALKNIEKFLDQPPQYFVKMDKWDAELLTPEDLSLDREGCRGKQKLLTLIGGSNGNLMWNLNKWHDGSGHNTEVLPFPNKEAAQGFIHEFISKRLAEESSQWELRELVSTANKYGIPVPAEIEEKVRAAKLQEAKEQLARLSAQSAILDRQIENLEKKP